MKAFDLGKLGFKKNKSNPYKRETWNNKEWERGYNAQYFLNLENLNETRKGGSRLPKEKGDPKATP